MAAVGFPTGVVLSRNKGWQGGNKLGKCSSWKWSRQTWKKSVEYTVRQRKNLLPEHYHRGICLFTLFLWNAKPPLCWRLLWKQLHFIFSKIFFPYLSDPLREIHLRAMTLASFTNSDTRLVELTHTCIQSYSHTGSPADWKKMVRKEDLHSLLLVVDKGIQTHVTHKDILVGVNAHIWRSVNSFTHKPIMNKQTIV